MTRESTKALRELDAHLGRGQLEFDPIGSVEAIFDRCDKTPFLDVLQKELQYRAGYDTPLDDAITPALDAAIGVQVGEARNRFHEEIIRGHEAGEISRSAAERAHRKINSAFDSVECAKVRDALLARKKDAFNGDLVGSDSVDEGMIRL